MAYLVELEDHPIRVTARGAWLHGDEPLHPRVERLFQEHVAVDDAGHYILQLQWRKAPLVVEDTAYFVRTWRSTESATGDLTGIELTVSDGRVEALDPTTLMQSSENVLYCRVERFGRKVPVRFTSAQYHEFALLIELDDAERAHLVVAGERYGLGAYDPEIR